MVMYSGLLLVCCLGFVAAGDEPLTPTQFHTHDQWTHGPMTTVCIQVRGPHGPELCGPVVPPPDSKDHPEMAGARSFDSSRAGLVQLSNLRGASGEDWVGQQSNPSMPLRSAVLQGFIGNGPVYKMEPGGAVETLPPMLRVNSFAPPPPVGLMKAQDQAPCLEHGVRFAGPPIQPLQPDVPPGHFFNPAPQLRTFPFAPFGFEQPSGFQQPGPQQPGSHQPGQQQQFQMRQAAAYRASKPQFMPAVRSADCLDNFQPSALSPMRASSSSLDSTLRQEDVKELTKQCAEQEKEINQKKEEISQLKKQLEKMSQSAKESSSTTETKTVTKSSQGQTEIKSTDKEFDESSSKQNSDMLGRKKKK